MTPSNFQEYTKWDNDIAGWVDTLVAKGDPWSVDPTPLVGQGPEKLPAS